MRKNEVSERPVRPRSKTAQLSSLLNELSVLRREHSRQRTLRVHAKEALVDLNAAIVIAKYTNDRLVLC